MTVFPTEPSYTISLTHVEEVDECALAWLTVTCPNLESLCLHNCIFKDEIGPEEENELVFAFADRLAREREIRQASQQHTRTRYYYVVHNTLDCTIN